MRFPLSLVLLFTVSAACWLSSSAQAQLTESVDSSLERQFKEFTTGKKFDGQDAAFSLGGKGYNNLGAAQIKSFYSPESFRTKDFLTGTYGTNKGFWMGDFKYGTKSADMKTFAKADTKFDTKTMAVKDARESDKNYKVKEYATQTTKFRGKSQDKFDKEGPQALTGPIGYGGELKELKTIDDVRELLNKNK